MEELTIIEQLSQLRITASSQIPPHEFLYTWNGTPCLASGQTFIGLKSLSDKPLRVLWIDTEQSPDSTCEILRDRIGAMIGEKPSEEQYHVFNLRSVNWQDRMLHVVTAISICRPDIVIFDGIRDVVGDINNYEEAQKLIGHASSTRTKRWRTRPSAAHWVRNCRTRASRPTSAPKTPTPVSSPSSRPPRVSTTCLTASTSASHPMACPSPARFPKTPLRQVLLPLGWRKTPLTPNTSPRTTRSTRRVYSAIY